MIDLALDMPALRALGSSRARFEYVRKWACRTSGVDDRGGRVSRVVVHYNHFTAARHVGQAPSQGQTVGRCTGYTCKSRHRCRASPWRIRRAKPQPLPSVNDGKHRFHRRSRGQGKNLSRIDIYFPDVRLSAHCSVRTGDTPVRSQTRRATADRGGTPAYNRGTACRPDR